MDYTYRTSAVEREKRIVLNEDHMAYLADGSLKMIRYSDIDTVWLERPCGLVVRGIHSCRIVTTDGDEVVVTPFNYEGEERVRQCDRYNYFLRIFHKMLSDQTNAKYHYGVPVGQYVLRLTIAILIVIFTYIGLHETQLTKWTVITAGVTGLVLTLFSFGFSINGFRKDYQPENLPMEALPA